MLILYHYMGNIANGEGQKKEPLFQREGLSREERLYLSMMDARQN